MEDSDEEEPEAAQGEHWINPKKRKIASPINLIAH
jgi:hypothetical protein